MTEPRWLVRMVREYSAVAYRPEVSCRCGPEGVAMTGDGVAARESGASGARGAARGPARAGTVEHLSRADRAARGKDARAVAPLDSHAEFSPGRGRDPVGLLLGQAESRVPELV